MPIRKENPVSSAKIQSVASASNTIQVTETDGKVNVEYLPWQLKSGDQIVPDNFLYNQKALSDVRNIAPTGWHVATVTDLHDMGVALGYNNLGSINITNTANSIGNALKEAGTAHFKPNNTGATNSSGFTARGLGFRNSQGFVSLNFGSFIWINEGGGNFRVLNIFESSGTVMEANSGVGWGYGVRLVKDDDVNDGTMTDTDGNVYQTVKIGNRVWMASNLKTTTFRTGELIPELANQDEWNASITAARCSYTIAGTTVGIISNQIVDVALGNGLDQQLVDSRLTLNMNVTNNPLQATPVDADEFPYFKKSIRLISKITWANIKSALRTYFNTLYQPVLCPILTTETGTSYTLFATDNNGYKSFTNANPIGVILPLEATRSIPVGTTVTLEQSAAGVITISGEAGVTVTGIGLKSQGQYSTITVIKKATNTWNVIGGGA